MMDRECLLKLGPNEVEEGMEGTNQALESSPPLPQEWDHLSSGNPLPLHPVPPPGPTAGGERNRHHHSSLHSQDLRASDPPLNPGLLWKYQVL